MKPKHQSAHQFAICINNTGHPVSLELHKIYRIIRDTNAAKEGEVRVIDESGEDYLYPSDWFARVKLPPAVQRSILRAA